MTRDDIQREAINTLKFNKRLIVQWATGVGKSKVAIDFINEVPLQKILLVVAETAHKENWRKEFIKFNKESLLNNVTVECYASLKNYRDSEWDLIIFDEAHHLGSYLRMDIFSTFKSKYVLALSATISNYELIYSLERTFGKFQSSKVDLQTAIDEGFIPKPKIVLIPLQLDYLHKTHTIIETRGKSAEKVTIECDYLKRWEYLNNKIKYPNLTLIIKCTEYEKYKYLCSQFEYWEKRYMSTRNERIKTKWLQYGLKRKQFLGEIKTDKAKKLIETLKDKKFICFCSNVSQAVELGGNNAIHYNNKNNAEVIDSFNNDKLKSLFAVGMLQEGQNLNNIEAGIIIQLDGKERSFIQKFGRTLRADDPIQYIFYYKFTKDEEYLNKALDGIDSNFIQEYEICD